MHFLVTPFFLASASSPSRWSDGHDQHMHYCSADRSYPDSALIVSAPMHSDAHACMPANVHERTPPPQVMLGWVIPWRPHVGCPGWSDPPVGVLFLVPFSKPLYLAIQVSDSNDPTSTMIAQTVLVMHMCVSHSCPLHLVDKRIHASIVSRSELQDRPQQQQQQHVPIPRLPPLRYLMIHTHAHAHASPLKHCLICCPPGVRTAMHPPP